MSVEHRSWVHHRYMSTTDMWCKTYSYLLSHRASPSFSWYQIMPFDNKVTYEWQWMAGSPTHDLLILIPVPWLGIEQICCPKCHFSSVQNHHFRPNFEFLSNLVQLVKCGWYLICKQTTYWFPSLYKEMQYFWYYILPYIRPPAKSEVDAEVFEVRQSSQLLSLLTWGIW